MAYAISFLSLLFISCLVDDPKVSGCHVASHGAPAALGPQRFPRDKIDVPVRNSTRFRKCMQKTCANVEELLCHWSIHGQFHCDIEHIKTAKETIARMIDLVEFHDSDETTSFESEEPSRRFFNTLNPLAQEQNRAQWIFMVNLITRIRHYNRVDDLKSTPQSAGPPGVGPISGPSKGGLYNRFEQFQAETIQDTGSSTDGLSFLRKKMNLFRETLPADEHSIAQTSTDADESVSDEIISEEETLFTLKKTSILSPSEDHSMVLPDDDDSTDASPHKTIKSEDDIINEHCPQEYSELCDYMKNCLKE